MCLWSWTGVICTSDFLLPPASVRGETRFCQKISQCINHVVYSLKGYVAQALQDGKRGSQEAGMSCYQWDRVGRVTFIQVRTLPSTENEQVVCIHYQDYSRCCKHALTPVERYHMHGMALTCRFELMAVEPMSHTILYGLARPFVCFITSPDCPTSCPRGKALRITPARVAVVDDAMGRVVLTHMYKRKKRAIPSFTACAPTLSFRVVQNG